MKTLFKTLSLLFCVVLSSQNNTWMPINKIQTTAIRYPSGKIQTDFDTTNIGNIATKKNLADSIISANLKINARAKYIDTLSTATIATNYRINDSLLNHRLRINALYDSISNISDTLIEHRDDIDFILTHASVITDSSFLKYNGAGIVPRYTRPTGIGLYTRGLHPSGADSLKINGIIFPKKIVSYESDMTYSDPDNRIEAKSDNEISVLAETKNGYCFYGSASLNGSGIYSETLGGTNAEFSSTSGLPLYARSTTGLTAILEQGNSTLNPVLSISRYSIGQSGNVSANILNIIDNPGTSGTKNYKLISATIDGGEKFYIYPRTPDAANAVGYLYSLVNNLPTTGALHSSWTNYNNTQLMTLGNYGLLRLYHSGSGNAFSIDSVTSTRLNVNSSGTLELKQNTKDFLLCENLSGTDKLRIDNNGYIHGSMPGAVTYFSDSSRLIDLTQNTWTEMGNQWGTLWPNVSKYIQFTEDHDTIINTIAGNYTLSYNLNINVTDANVYELRIQTKSGATTTTQWKFTTSGSGANNLKAFGIDLDLSAGTRIWVEMRNTSNSQDLTILGGYLSVTCNFLNL